MTIRNTKWISFVLTCITFCIAIGINGKTIVENDKVYNQIIVKADSLVQLGKQYRLSFEYNTNDSTERIDSPSWDWDKNRDSYTILNGPSTSTSTNISIKSGKTTISYDKTFSFTIVYNKEGLITLPPMIAKTASGKMLQSDSIKVTVTKQTLKTSPPSSEKTAKSSKNDYLFMETTVNKNHVELGDSIECEVRLYSNMNVTQLYNVSHFSTGSSPAYCKEIELPKEKSLEYVEYKGKSMGSALCKKMVIIPMQAGKLTIEPMKYEVVYKVIDNSVDPIDAIFGGDSLFSDKDTIIGTNPITIQVDKVENKQHSAKNTEIKTFSPNHTLGIVIDRSSSLLAKPDSLSDSYMDLENQFVEQFLIGESMPDHSVTFFAGRPHYPSTSELSNIRDVKPSENNDGSAIFDAILASALREGAISTKHPPFSILLITDGNDNKSRLSEKTLTNILLQHNIRVDVVTFASKKQSLYYFINDSIGAMMIKNTQYYSDVERIAKATNGQFILIEDKSQIPDAIRQIKGAILKREMPNHQPEKGFEPDKNLINSLYNEIMSDAMKDF